MQVPDKDKDKQVPDKYAPRAIPPPQDKNYEFVERAAIIEFDAKLPRNVAEFLAARERQKTPAQQSVFTEFET